MLRKLMRILGVGFVTLFWGFSAAFAQTAPSLGTAADYTVLGLNSSPVVGTVTCTDTGPGTAINGDVGSTFNSITNTGCTITGAIDAPVAGSVVTDFNSAYTAIDGNACTGAVIPTTTSTLAPGVYCSAAGTTLGAGVILTLNGTASDVWVFRVGTGGAGDLVLNSAQVVMGGAAQECNVYWKTAQAVALTDADFVGTVLSGTTVTMTRGSWTGRAFARTDATVTNAAPLTFAGCAAAAAVLRPTLGKGFNPFLIAPGATSILTITLSNPDVTVATLTAPLTDTLPTGVVIAATPSASTTCGGSGAVSASAGGSTITLGTGRTIPAVSGGTPGTCTVTVNVTAPAAGVFINSLAIGALQTSNGTNALAALSTLTVAAGERPTLGKGFSPFTMTAGEVSTLTITLANPDPTRVAVITARLVDTLPTGVVIAATPNAQTTCAGSGVVGADPGGRTVTLQPTGRIPAATGTTPGTCTVTVDVTASAAGTYLNTLPANALQTSNGTNLLPATTTLTVVAAVPTLSEWAMILLATLLSLAGFAAIRRRRAL